MSEVFDSLVRAMMEVKAHQEGSLELPTIRIEMHSPDVPGENPQAVVEPTE